MRDHVSLLLCYVCLSLLLCMYMRVHQRTRAQSTLFRTHLKTLASESMAWSGRKESGVRCSPKEKRSREAARPTRGPVVCDGGVCACGCRCGCAPLECVVHATPYPRPSIRVYMQIRNSRTCKGGVEEHARRSFTDIDTHTPTPLTGASWKTRRIRVNVPARAVSKSARRSLGKEAKGVMAPKRPICCFTLLLWMDGWSVGGYIDKPVGTVCCLYLPFLD